MPPSTAAAASAAEKKKPIDARKRAQLSLPVRGITNILKCGKQRRVRRATTVAFVSGGEQFLIHLIKETHKRMKREHPDKPFYRITPQNIDRTVRDMPELRSLLHLPAVPRPIGGALIKKAPVAASA